MGLVHGAPLLLLIVSAVTFFFLSEPGAEAALDQSTLELVWQDDFVGGAVDWDKWVVDEGDGCDVGLCDWGNGEKQYYRSENAAVVDGNLVITAKKEDFSSRFYTSSKLTTKNKYSFRYGRAEARIKLPEGGQGLWPAFWMMPQDNAYGKWAASGEIDIFESRNNLTEVVNNLNFGNAFPNNSNYNGECFLDVTEGTLQEFHTFAVEWDEGEFVWYMDGEQTCRREEWFSTDVKTGESRPKPAPFDQDFYLVLNLALGGNEDFVGDGPVDDSILPADMLVEWVRVYQSPELFGEGPTSVYLGNAVGGGSRQGALTWGDDFNASEPAAEWEIVIGESCLGAESLCAAEIQVFHTRGVSVAGGLLELTAVADAATTTGVISATTGLLHTSGGFDFAYGRLEANISAPAVPGVVSTVSLLTTAVNVTGQVEMVALENGVAMGRIWYPLGDEGATGNYSCLSSGPIGSNSGSSSSSASDGGGLGDYGSSSFFTFAVEWTDDRFRWYAAGRQYCEITKLEVVEAGGSWPFDEAMYVAVGVTVGRDLDGNSVAVNYFSLPPATSNDSAVLRVGSIRAYQYADLEGASLPASATRYEREGNLTWQDEFDGVELDEEAAEEAGEGVMGLEYWWQHEEGDGCEMGICGFGNGEAQWYRKENTGVIDGKLVVTAKAEAYAGNIYTSAKLSTNTTVVMSYGRIEARVKLPSAQGLWPSIWMLPQDSPYGGWASGGAIDILQARNSMSRAHAQLVFGGEYPDVDNLDLYQGGHCFSDSSEDFSEDYHVFALEWEVDAFRWYIDGVLYCDRNYWYSRPGPGEEDYDFPAPFDTGFYLILNIAVGGDFTGGPIDEEALAENPAMLVDYVRIYTLEGQSVFVSDPPDPGSSSSGGSGSVVSVVTAVSVLVVLAVLFTICVLINCIASRMSKKGDAGEQATNRRRGIDVGGGGGEGGVGGDGRFHEDPHGKLPAKTSLAPAASAGLPLAGSSRSVGRRRAVKQTYLIDGGGGDSEALEGRPARAMGLPPTGSKSGEAATSGAPPASSRGTAPVAGGGGATNLPASGRQRGAAVPSPRWGRGIGADEDRYDVAPGRVAENGGVALTDSGAKPRKHSSRVPRRPSGDIPEEWTAAGDESAAVVGATGRGERVAEAVRARVALGRGEEEASTSASDASVVVSSVSVVIDEDIGRYGGGGGGSTSGGFGSGPIVSSTRKSGSYIATADYQSGGDGGGGGRGRGGGEGLGRERGRAGEGLGGRTNNFVRSSSVCSDESEMPPSMAGLTLDSVALDEAREFKDSGLPSYTEAVNSNEAEYL